MQRVVELGGCRMKQHTEVGAQEEAAYAIQHTAETGTAAAISEQVNLMIGYTPGHTIPSGHVSAVQRFQQALQVDSINLELPDIKVCLQSTGRPA